MKEEKDVIIGHDGTEYAIEEIKNSKRIQKSVTPKYDVTWYVKWISSVIILFAIAIRASGVHDLQWIDILLSAIGAVGWCYVGYKWNDRALVLLNGVVVTMLATGLIKHFFS